MSSKILAHFPKIDNPADFFPLDISHKNYVLLEYMLKRLKRKRYIFLGLLLIGVLFQLSIGLIRGEGSGIVIIWPKPGAARPVLQLNTFSFITLPPAPTSSVPAIPPGVTVTITPTPGLICQNNSIKKSTCECHEHEAWINACPVDANEECPPSYVHDDDATLV